MERPPDPVQRMAACSPNASGALHLQTHPSTSLFNLSGRAGDLHPPIFSGVRGSNLGRKLLPAIPSEPFPPASLLLQIGSQASQEQFSKSAQFKSSIPPNPRKPLRPTLAPKSLIFSTIPRQPASSRQIPPLRELFRQDSHRTVSRRRNISKD